MKAAVILAVVSALLGGCAPKADRHVLTLWAAGREGEVIAQLLPRFEREHPGLHVVVQQLPFTAAHEKLLTAFAGDSTPDIAQMGNSWVPEFVALGALQPLDARVPALDPKDYFSGAWNSNVVDGHVYGVPWYVDTRLLFYRRDLLAKAGFDHPPRDWAEWRRMMVAIKRLVGRDKFAALLPLNEYEPMEALAVQQDAPMLRDGGRYGNFRSAGFKHMLGFYLGLFRDGLAPVAANTQISNVWDEFDRGTFSFYITGPWQIGEFKRRLPASRQHIWMTAPLPGPTGPGASIAGGSSLVVFKRSTKQAAAWALIAYLARPEVQIEFHALTGDLPPRASVWRSPGLTGDVYARAFADQLTRTRALPQVPEWERIATELRLVSEAAAHGRMTLDEAATEMDRRADAILAKRRWMLARKAAS